MMRSSSPYLLLAFLILLAVLCSGCAMLGGGSSGGEGGLTDITTYAQERASLEEALDQLEMEQAEGLLDLTAGELTQVIGIRVDRTGHARTWTLGFRAGDSTRVLEYTAGKWNDVDVQIPLPEERILLDQLILPSQLYTQQKTAIGEALSRHGVNETELMLQGELYTVTVPSQSGTTVLTFNARTGGLGSSA